MLISLCFQHITKYYIFYIIYDFIIILLFIFYLVKFETIDFFLSEISRRL